LAQTGGGKIKSKIICADTLAALRKMPECSVDVGVTSPPYNKQENKKGWLVANVKYDSIGDKKSEDQYQREQREVLDELYRVIKPGGSFFYNHKVRSEQGQIIHPISWVSQSAWAIRQEIIWNRKITGNIRGWRFWQIEERIYWLYKPVNGQKIGREIQPRHAKLSSVWEFPPERNNQHPAPFPLVLPLRAIYSVLDEARDKIVLDPYCGSGTTLVAAKLMGHRYVGIDISEAYIAMARERIKNSPSERKTWWEEKAKHAIVGESFADRKAKGMNTGKFAPGRGVKGGNRVQQLNITKNKAALAAQG